MDMDRREFLKSSICVGASLAILPLTHDMPVAAEEKEVEEISPPKEDPYSYANIHIGLLMEVLHPGQQAKASCPNPYYPGCAGIYLVSAGRFVHHPWPIGHPVAFTSIDGRFVTIGW